MLTQKLFVFVYYPFCACAKGAKNKAGLVDQNTAHRALIDMGVLWVQGQTMQKAHQMHVTESHQ